MADTHKLTDEALSEYESEVPSQQLKKSPRSVGQHWPSSPELLQASFTSQDASSGVTEGGDGLGLGLTVGGVMYMHSYQFGDLLLLSGVTIILLVMIV